MHVRAILLIASALSLAACGGGTKKPVGVHETKPPPGGKKPPTAAAGVTGHVLASVSERAIGPFSARHGGGEGARGLAAWVTPAEGTGRRVVVLPLGATGQPRGPEKAIAVVPVDTTSLVVRPMRGPAPGFVVAWTALIDRGESLWVSVVGDEGAPRGKAIELGRTNDDIVWLDVVPTEMGAVCLWAEETRSGDANVNAAALDTDGKVRAPVARMARGVSGWHALELPTGVGLSTVGARAGESKGGTLTFQRLDAEAHPSGPPLVVASKPTVTGDVEVVRVGDKTIFAWTDQGADEPFVSGASLDDKGNVEPPRRLAQGRGGASLVALTSGPHGAALMFESPVRKKTESRRVHLARIGREKLDLVGKVYSFESLGRSLPEVAPTTSGFAMIAPLRDCEDGAPSCAEAPILPTLLRIDSAMAVVQREPFEFGGDPASLAWNFSCDGDVCHALAASGSGPARIRAAEVRPRANAAVVAKPTAPGEGPRVSEVSAIVQGQTVVDLAVTHLGDATLVATLTSNANNAALVLSTRLLDASGAAGGPNTVSARALPVGGVAIAPAEKPEDGAAVVWVGRDNGDPEVHVTRLDKRGRKVNEVQLTTTKGDASDVAIAWAGNGWIVAWVDGRDGNSEVYAAKITPELQRVSREERITKAPGDASDLVALGRDEMVWLSWADARESPRDGMADIYVSAVKKHDAKKMFDEQRLLASASHSRSPQLAAAEGSLYVAWIEEAPAGTTSPSSSGYGAMWAKLDDKGGLVGRATRVPLGGDGAASSVALEASRGGVLRAVVARTDGDAIALDAIDLVKSPRATPLLTLDGPPSLDVALVLDGGVLYFNDDGPYVQDRRARRARIAW